MRTLVPSTAWLTVRLLLLLSALWCAAAAIAPPAQVALASLELTMSTQGAGAGQVYWTTSQSGYQESAMAALAVLHDGQLHAYRVALPDSVIQRIRIDPGSAPGQAALQRVVLRCGSNVIEVEPSRLHPLLQVESTPSPGVFRLTGSDPAIELLPPPAFTQCQQAGGPAAWLPIVAALLLLAAMLGVAWNQGADEDALRFDPVFWILLALCTMGIVFWATGFAMQQVATTVMLGLRLCMAALLLALPGSVLVRRLPAAPFARAPLFASILCGLVVLVAYICIRSWVAGHLPLPLTRAELWAVCLAAGATLLVSPDGRGNALIRLRGSWIWLELGVLLAICGWAAGRELPRDLLLSSDPDTYAYMGEMIGRLGRIPADADRAFGYSAGAGIVGWLVSALSGLSGMNAVSVLPTWLWMLSAALVASLGARWTRSPWSGLVLHGALATVMCAGLLFPLYKQFAHLEGTARQMAIAPLALLMVGAVTELQRRPAGISVAGGAIMGLCVLALGLLNPVPVFFPVIAGMAWLVSILLFRERLGMGAWCVLLIPMLFLADPWYAQLVNLQPSRQRFALQETLPVLSLQDALQGTMQRWTAALGHGLSDLASLLPQQAFPLFALGAVLLIVVGVAGRGQLAWRNSTALAVGLALLGVVLFGVFADAMLMDRRLYLLSAYFQMAMGHVKAVVLLLLMLWALLGLQRRFAKFAAPAMIAFTITFAFLTVSALDRYQPMEFTPRVLQCGSVGCMQADDRAVIAEIESLHRKGSLHGKILLPNFRYTAGHERWFFPAAASRALPFRAVPDVAFFYFQGDRDFSADAYERHVCSRLDVAWLRAQDIRYLFLPAERMGVCVDGLDQLERSARVIAASGQSKLIVLP